MKLDAETVGGLIRDFEPALTIRGFSRLAGGSTDIYKIDLAGSRYSSLVLKIYPDVPEGAFKGSARWGLAQRFDATGSDMATHR
ncbi:hypothetical protein [Neorhizobium sp. LjRoot104]|uniref:hypothetical protein n=1 Tax=Neorhizobium sp. LjRoot104 TaxID=3342254 RepID=UPI003ECE394F